jgi:N-acetylmuramoyl-L-alanine amidase
MAEYPEAIEYYVDPSRVFVGSNSHSAITVHGTGGNPAQTVEQLGDYFRTTSSEVSSHFGIGRDGRIAQYVRLADGSAANCCLEAGYDPFWDQFNGDNLNIHTISIEHENDVTNSLPLTPAQQDASFKLIAWLCSTYNLTFDQVKTHASIAPSSRANCPGAAFPMNELQAYLNNNGGTTDMAKIDLSDLVMAQYFQDQGGGRWLCKNTGAILFGANQDFYCSNGNVRLFGLPTSSEIYPAQYPGTAIVPCERAIIVYDPQHKIDNPPDAGACYLMHIDSGLGQDLLTHTLQGEISTLQSKIVTLQQQLSSTAQQAQIVALEAKIAQAQKMLAG